MKIGDKVHVMHHKAMAIIVADYTSVGNGKKLWGVSYIDEKGKYDKKYCEVYPENNLTIL